MKRIIIAAILALVAIAIFKTARASTDLTATGNVLPDSQPLIWGTNTGSALIYGSNAADYVRIRANGTDSFAVAAQGVQIGSYVGGATSPPTNGAIISGAVGIGTNSPGSSQLNVLSATASSTGTVVNSAASPTADGFEYKINGSTSVVISPNGHLALRAYTKVQIDALVPDYIGALILDVNATNAYALCVATGTAASQWRVVSGAGGCGSNN